MRSGREAVGRFFIGERRASDRSRAPVAVCSTGRHGGPIAGRTDARTRSVAPVGDEFGPNPIA